MAQTISHLPPYIYIVDSTSIDLNFLLVLTIMITEIMYKYSDRGVTMSRRPGDAQDLRSLMRCAEYRLDGRYRNREFRECGIYITLGFQRNCRCVARERERERRRRDGGESKAKGTEKGTTKLQKRTEKVTQTVHILYDNVLQNTHNG